MGQKVPELVGVVRIERSTDGGATWSAPVIDESRHLRELLVLVGDQGVVRVVYGAYMDWPDTDRKVH